MHMQTCGSSSRRTQSSDHRLFCSLLGCVTSNYVKQTLGKTMQHQNLKLPTLMCSSPFALLLSVFSSALCLGTTSMQGTGLDRRNRLGTRYSPTQILKKSLRRHTPSPFSSILIFLYKTTQSSGTSGTGGVQSSRGNSRGTESSEGSTICLTVSGQNANLVRAFTTLGRKAICNKAFLIWLGNVIVTHQDGGLFFCFCQRVCPFSGAA